MILGTSHGTVFGGGEGMRVAESLLNRAEEIAFRELDDITKDNKLRLFAKVRLSDVVIKIGHMPSKLFNFYTRSHVDFAVTDKDAKPLFIVEYDGPNHAEVRQRERDRMKDALCKDVGLGILRINANHVKRRYRDVSVLRWIIEVTELEKAFYKAQEAGYIAWDEPFDATSIFDNGRGKMWPYWLSFPAIQNLKTFIEEGNGNNKRGYAAVTGRDSVGNLHAISYVWNGEVGICAKTAVRKQGFNFPDSDLLHELSLCELSENLKLLNVGKIQGVNREGLISTVRQFCNRYGATPSYWAGYGPPGVAWDVSNGWRFE